MNRSEIRSADLRKIQAFSSDLAQIHAYEDLIECSITHILNIVPCDCLCWNEWNRDITDLRSVQSHDGYDSEIFRKMESLQATVSTHPIIANDKMHATRTDPILITDFQTTRSFRQTPLYYEVYKHLDADYQIAFTRDVATDTAISITANRRIRNFSRTDSELIRLASDCFQPVAATIIRTERIRKRVSVACSVIEKVTGLDKLDRLTPSEWRLLNQLANCGSLKVAADQSGLRPDHLRETAQRIRAKVGVSSTRELIAALRDLQPTKSFRE